MSIEYTKMQCMQVLMKSMKILARFTSIKLEQSRKFFYEPIDMPWHQYKYQGTNIVS